MSRLTLSTRMLAISGSVIVLFVAGGILLTAQNHPTPNTTNPKTTLNKNQTRKTTAPTAATPTNKTTNLTTSNTSAADKQVNAAANNQPATDACTLLTRSAAQQLLGQGATPSTPGDTSDLQTTGTSLSSCAYADGGNTLQLVIRKSTSAVGASENDVAFGSNKPADAIAVQGYGQSAYWDPSKSTLNILGSNNWYIISRSSNTQADAEAAAKLLQSGF